MSARTITEPLDVTADRPSDNSVAMKPLKCPFCGRPANFAKGKRYTKPAAVAGQWMRPPAIGCGACKIRRSFDSVEEALAWWNKRK